MKMILNKLLLDGLATIRRKQHKANKPIHISIVYNEKKQTLYFSAQIKSSSSSQIYLSKMKIQGVLSSPVQTNEFKYRYRSRSGDIYLAPIKGDQEVSVNCTCPDDYFMWQYANSKVNSLIGKHKKYIRVPGSNRPPKNPTLSPGCCKHTLRLIQYIVNKDILEVKTKTDIFIQQSFKDY